MYPKPVMRSIPTVVTRETSTNSVINSALDIISGQVELLRVKSAFGAPLESEEVKNLRSYVQSLTELRKDERQQELHDRLPEGLEDLTTEELIALARGEQKALEAPADDKEPTKA